MPTEDEILVPETLLKKRKSQEKAREERSAELEKKKKVSSTLFSTLQVKETAVGVGDGDETYQLSRLDLWVDAVAYINHLSGLNRPRKTTLLLHSLLCQTC